MNKPLIILLSAIFANCQPENVLIGRWKCEQGKEIESSKVVIGSNSETPQESCYFDFDFFSNDEMNVLDNHSNKIITTNHYKYDAEINLLQIGDSYYRVLKLNQSELVIKDTTVSPFSVNLWSETKKFRRFP